MFKWYLGIVSEYVSPTLIKISHLYKTSLSNPSSWKFPDSANVIETPVDQIIYAGFPVKYECISIIKCLIQKNTIDKIEKKFSSYVKSLK